MKWKATAVVTLALLGACPVFSQIRNAIVGAGYTEPSLGIAAAPGQVVTLFVRGIPSKLSRPVLPRGEVIAMASSLPLSTTLAGISVEMVQRASPQGPILVPLFAVSQSDGCGEGFPAPPWPCGTLTSVTIQIPFELFVDPPGAGYVLTNSAAVVVSDSGVSGEPVRLVPVSSRIHLITGFVYGPSPSPIFLAGPGSLIQAPSVRSGEIVVLYAFGLGRTAPAVRTGAAAPTPAPVVDALLTFDFAANAPLRDPAFPALAGGTPLEERPIFAGLTPGFVGLYQINFRIPQMPEGTPACGGTILSNLTVTIRVPRSFAADGLRLCVQP